jgi:peroxiredoxin
MPRLFAVFCVCFLAGADDKLPLSPSDKVKQGHSRHGSAFDSGPREKPWLMKDIGAEYVKFPITTKNPEVQQWFTQGVTLLHSFWDYEAERAFRWCLKLEPDNAMAYWGLARAAGSERGKEFLREAVKRKNTVTERERLYIEAMEESEVIDPLRDRSENGRREASRNYGKKLESICVRYPDDLEARALLALAHLGDDRYGAEMMIREVLAKQPNHPGAHHYRIHNWNYHEPEQALESCRRYGAIASGSGHALHMPGHVYATVGMWNEAAISMDSATRIEKKNMAERMTFPFNHWNYGHNRNYLSYIQEQLGMANAAVLGAKQLIEAPLDPKQNVEAESRSGNAQGKRAMLRALVKFERWNELLAPDTIGWNDSFSDKLNKAYAETRAYLGLSKLDKAEVTYEAYSKLKAALEKNKGFEEEYNLKSKELKARILLARGDRIPGLALLAEAAQLQYDQQKGDNDPPFYPEVLYIALGHAYLSASSPALAVESFEKALTLTRNDWFALAGLVQAYKALKDDAKAKDAMGRLLYVTADADPNLPALERAKATGISAEMRDTSPAKQRNYKKVSLNQLGPELWEPYAAPKLDAVDPERKPVTLDEYKGKNVILVFYLGKECLHCMNQLRQISKKAEDWQRLETVVLAVSPNKPEDNAAALNTLKLDGIRVLSDQDSRNARRFKSYDDFEELEIHSTVLIDKKGRVYWSRNGGEPFGDMEFLVKQVERMNTSVSRASQIAGK